MTRRPGKNSAASIHQRLLNVAKARGEEFQSVLTRFALERLLYRLSTSSHRDDFVLKGALVFTLWADVPHRATWDLDLLGRGTHDGERLRAVFTEICAVPPNEDAILFDVSELRTRRIREDEVYEGVQLHFTAHLGKAVIPIQIDVGFGDAVTPRPRLEDYPSLLGLPAPRLKVYPRETVIAEKTEALIVLGLENSRMKDLFDLWILSKSFSFDGSELTAAIAATLARRQTAVPETVPIALTPEFAVSAVKRAQWTAFLKKARLKAGPPPLSRLVPVLHDFLWPPLASVHTATPFTKTWQPGGPWKARRS